MAAERVGSERPVGTASASTPRRGAEVVAAVDGMHAGLAAVVWAADEADRLGQPLRLVHIIEWPRTTDEVEPAEAAALSTEVLAEAAAQAHSVSPSVDVVMSSRWGRLGPTLLELATQPRTLVLGHRTMTGYASMVLGSVSVAVASRAAGPVVVVPETTSAWQRTSPPLVVVGTDDSPDARRAVAYAFAYASRHRFALEVVTAERAGPEVAAERADPEVTSIARTHPDVAWRARRVRSTPVEALTGSAADASLLVVGGNRSCGQRSPVLGSVSRGVIFLARCPVAVV
jgi:nucleotide-binding universal stress UspA family protein